MFFILNATKIAKIAVTLHLKKEHTFKNIWSCMLRAET